MSSPEGRSRTARTMGLASAMLVVSWPLVLAVHRVQPDTGGLQVSWWMLAIAFAVCEMLVFHVEVREEAHSFSFSELPMVLGLFFAAPIAILVGRLVGEAAFLVGTRSRSPLKVAFNLAMFAAESAVAITVFHLLSGGADPLQPRAWIAALAAVAASDLLGALAVTLVIRWHSGSSSLATTTIAAVSSAAANGSLAVVASLLVLSNPLALILLAVLATILLGAYRAHSDLTQRYANLNLLYDFTDAVSGSTDAVALIAAILTHARTLLRAQGAEMVLFAGDGTPAFRYVATDADGSDEQAPPDQLLSILDQRIGDGGSLLAPRGTKDPAAQSYLDLLGVRDGIVVPLQIDGTVVGAITVNNRLAEVSTFDEEDQRLFEALANHASIAMDNSRLIGVLREEVRQREHQALHDALTGLPNRTLFTDHCAAALAASQADGITQVGVLLLDVDRFKEVNDTLGHHVGDEILQEVGRQLTEMLPVGATVARLGGDEFAVLLPQAESREVILLTAERLREAIAEPIHVHDLELVIEASMGLAVSPEHGADPATLLQRADIAMYAAKAAHSGIDVYSAAKDHYSPRRLTMATELRQALADRALSVHFQPKTSLFDGGVIGAEALVRWEHPQQGFISPVDFIPLAERTDLIRPLTAFVLDEAIAHCSRWHADGHRISVAVNIAVRSLLDEDLLNHLQVAIPGSGIGFGDLTLEVTESGIMTDAARAIDMLDRIAAKGVHLSVDDFGTGYSSLSYLQRLPVDEVKIDRSFVFNAGTHDADAAIVRSIVDLGHGMNLRVVAEGVEDQLTMDRLASVGCDVAQGYFISRPMPGAQFSAWLAQHQPSTAAPHAFSTAAMHG